MSERHVSKNYFHIAGLSNRGTGRGSRVASVRAGRRNAAARIRIVRGRHLISRFGWVAATSALLLGLLAGTAFAQQIEFTPKTSITPSSQVTSWVWQMAIAAGVLGVLILIGVGLGYLRFAPKFYGRDEKPAASPPGSRPPTLARQAAAVRWRPPVAAERGGSAAPQASAPSPGATATAVAERPPPATRPAAAPSEGAAAAAASVAPTAGAGGEVAVQADAVGAAEAAAAEPRPAAKTAEEAGAPTPPPAPPPPSAPPSPPSPGAAAALDQETFDRVLEEQLGKGVDRRVAEGRARAAAVVAARKKSQS